jgi:hypothetical protein
VREVGGSFECSKSFGDGRVENDDFHRGLEGDQGSRLRCHTSSVSGGALIRPKNRVKVL